MFFKEASSVENNPFWANVSIGRGFSVLCRSQSRFIPIKNHQIGCNKVRSDSCTCTCYVLCPDYTSEWFILTCHAIFFIFSFCVNEWDRGEGWHTGTCASFKMKPLRFAWKQPEKKTEVKQWGIIGRIDKMSPRFAQLGNWLLSASNMALRWHRGSCLLF